MQPNGRAKEDAAPSRLSILDLRPDTATNDTPSPTAVAAEEGSFRPWPPQALQASAASVIAPAPAQVAEDMPTSSGSDPNGKAALPELEVEGIDGDEPELADARDETNVEPVFTPEDEAALSRLEARVLAGVREAFTALREIRQRQLWKLIKDEQGRRKYKTFDAYVGERWGHTRQWVTHGTNWLTITETLEQAGIADPPHLSVDAAQGLLPGRLTEAGGLLAVLQEAKEDGVRLTKDNLKEIVLRRATYNADSRSDGPRRPAASTYAEYKKDCQVARKLGRGTWGLVTDARNQPGDTADNLVRLCIERNQLPAAEELLTVTTGKTLEDLVERLAAPAERIAKDQADKNRLETLNKQIAALKRERDAHQAELEQRGVVEPKQRRRGDPPTEGGQPASDDEDDRDEGEAENEMSPVRAKLDHALQSLREALDVSDWPEDTDELRAIVEVALGAKHKLAELANKAKELLADAALEPEAIPSAGD